MDTFFATRKGGRSTRGNMCCQLFVTDKGFLYVVPMRSKSDVLLVVKQFMKEVGAPDALISDGAGEQKLDALKYFCREVGTTLKLLSGDALGEQGGVVYWYNKRSCQEVHA